MLTLRDATDDALFSRIKRVHAKIEEKMAIQHQRRHEQIGGSNGQCLALQHRIATLTQDIEDDGRLTLAPLMHLGLTKVSIAAKQDRHLGPGASSCSDHALEGRHDLFTRRAATRPKD